MNVNFKFWRSVTIADLSTKLDHENEDFINYPEKADKGYIQWVLCDGAGGAGVFCGEWAEYLGQRVPLNPAEINKGNRNRWLDRTSAGFYREVISKKDLSDLVLQKKVYHTGSYSTLGVCWIDKLAGEVFFSAVGDSGIFLFGKAEDVWLLDYMSAFVRQEDADASPDLLNWNVAAHGELSFDSRVLPGEFCVVMASDALAKWVLLNLEILEALDASIWLSPGYYASLCAEKYANRTTLIREGAVCGSLDSFLDHLAAMAADKSTFQENMRELLSRNEIDADDFSLIIIRGHVS